MPENAACVKLDTGPFQQLRWCFIVTKVNSWKPLTILTNISI